MLAVARPTEQQAIAGPSKSEPVTNENIVYWNRTVLRPLHHLLSSNNYSPQQISRFVTFFTQCISPALGQRQDQADGKVGWNSLMCDDGSPIEIGIAWKGETAKGGGGQVRFSIEAIDNEEVNASGSNVRATQALLKSLQQNGYLADRRLFDMLDRALPPTIPGRSRYFIGFDILRPQKHTDPLVDVKAYFVLPSLCASREDQGMDRSMDQLDDILAQISPALPAPGYPQLKKYLSTLPQHERGTPIILSVDLGNSFPEVGSSRVKLYWRYPTCSTEAVRSHMNLGGQWGQDIQQTGEQAWAGLMGRDSSPTQVDPYSSTGGSLFYYDISKSFQPGDRGTAPAKAYIPIRHMLHDDEAVVSEKFTRQLKASDRSSAIPAYISSLSAFYQYSSSSSRLHLPQGTHTYICAEGVSSSPGYCVYLKPCLRAQ